MSNLPRLRLLLLFPMIQWHFFRHHLAFFRETKTKWKSEKKSFSSKWQKRIVWKNYNSQRPIKFFLFNRMIIVLLFPQNKFHTIQKNGSLQNWKCLPFSALLLLNPLGGNRVDHTPGSGGLFDDSDFEESNTKKLAEVDDEDCEDDPALNSNR